ncbi:MULTISPECIES: MBL fold metallo-hydrolase [Desulfosediminicola]|uniref:MBL fold metallo-hydrolase n=1 Tax=Desulfosediminicola TaxID=2886823 RepID=UPI0010AB8F96|nr:MBL fold metallo-hydrolase [Desulfosediminicola ganghwensis]
MKKSSLYSTVFSAVAFLVLCTCSAQAAGGGAVESDWSPTRPCPRHEVYFPGTEELKPDEMRVITIGSGMPMPRLKQAAAGFLIELGNGDKFIFDVGTGSFTTLYSLGIPLDYMTKIFISHQHADHMGDLPTFWIYGMQNGRSQPLVSWGPGGGGMPDSWGMKAAMDGILQFYNWMLETSKGGLDTRSLAMQVTFSGDTLANQWWVGHTGRGGSVDP